MSSVGKTTFAQLLVDRSYYCFDALFSWHDIEAFGLSMSSNFRYIREQCVDDRFVLDGWHLGDSACSEIPTGAAVYVLYMPYEDIIKQYRIDVPDPQMHKRMFEQWYTFEVASLPHVRYFLNAQQFIETDRDAYLTFLERSR